MAVGEDRVPIRIVEAPASAMYSLQEVADRVGRTRQAMHARVKRGTLRAQRVGGSWLVTAEVLDALVAGEQAKAVSAGTVRTLHPDAHPPSPEDPAGLLPGVAQRVTELEAELSRALEQLARKDAYIDDLRRHAARLREALAMMSADPEPPEPPLPTSAG